MSDSKNAWQRKQEEERKEQEEEEEDDVDETAFKSQKDAVLFAIDVSKSMLSPPSPSDSKKADTDSATTAALKCAYQIMQQRIISTPKDMMGILLFGTEQSKFQDDDDPNSRGGLAYPHCYLFTDLDVPAASDVRALKDMVEDEDEASKLLVPADEPVSMSNMLFCANQIFTTKAPNFGSRRLFIITDQDDPHAADKALKSSAAVRAKDLYDLGVIIELFPISRPDHDFDTSKFYDDIIYRDTTEADAPGATPSMKASVGGDGISLLNSLISNVNSKQVAKRALFSNLSFEIGPGLEISVKGYNILQRQQPARSCYVWLNGETAQIPVGETTQIADDSARTVQKTEIKKAYKFGGEQVLFTKEEQKELKNFGPPGLRIIGFKPQSLLPSWASVSKSTFIYPSEEDFVGSTRVFAALWKKLLKDKLMGLGWYIPRANANPQIVALLPSSERLDEVSKQPTVAQNAGIWIYPLPFADDIRKCPECPTPIVSPDILVDKMRVIIQQLQLPGARFEPSRYPNPALQWHYRILQAMALDEEIPEFKDGDDKTLPKYRQIDKRAGELVIDWGISLEKECNAWKTERGSSFGGAGIKREAGESKTGIAKRPKTTDNDNKGGLEILSVEDLRDCVESGTISKCTVAELKAWLGSKGLNQTGKKADLVERLEEWLENH